MKREVIKGAVTPTPMAHYCQGVLAGETVYAAGQIASDYRTGVPPEARQDPAFPYYGSNIQKQARYVLANLKSVFEAAGLGLQDVVKSQVFLTDLNDFYYFDQAWKEFFPSPPPRTTVQVSGLLVPGCKVEIDLWGVKSNISRKVITGSKTPTPMAHYCRAFFAATRCNPPDRSAWTNRPACRPTRGRTRRSRTSAPTSRSRRATSWITCAASSTRQAATSRTW